MLRNKGLLLAIAIILAVSASYFYIQNKSIRLPNLPIPTPAPDPYNTPVITNPKPNSTITSPTTIEGTVPPGWMFENVLPIKLLDANRNVIVDTFAKAYSGDWMSEEPVKFKKVIFFTSKEASGFIVIEKDNPSGLPENSQSFEIPVKFAVTQSNTCPETEWVDCMPTIGAQDTRCSQEYLAWAQANCSNFKGAAY